MVLVGGLLYISQYKNKALPLTDYNFNVHICGQAIFKNSMKIFFYSLAILFFSNCAKAQESSPFTVGFEKSSASKILSEQRKIWIHIPNSN